jgi:hypothetical protein
MILVRKKIRKTGRKIIRRLHKHLEDAEEKGSRGDDTKSVPEVEMERLGDEAEEGADGDDLGEEDREYLIKGDRFKTESEDTTDEEMMMQDEALKNQEISKEELAPAVEITDTTGTRAYHIDAEHDLDHREITGAVKLKNNPNDKHEEVNVLRERVNRSVWEVRVDKGTVRHSGNDNKEKTAVKYWYEKPEGRDGMT